MPDASVSVMQFIEKLLLFRGARDISCRVYPPAANLRTYSVILEGHQYREQFYLDARQVEEFAKTGEERYILTEVRAALRNLEKQIIKRKASRRH
ncbi:MAG: hypothetical protein HY313_01740 [Acidobacteria bacterium]|nr:hypothetical protein [Acidobacteriota bacterium]